MCRKRYCRKKLALERGRIFQNEKAGREQAKEALFSVGLTEEKFLKKE